VTTATSIEGVAQACRDPATQVVLLPRPQPPEAWEEELGSVIVTGALRITRTELDGVDADRLATWLDRAFPAAGLTRDTRDAAISDLLRLVQLVGELTGTEAFRFRILTEAPDRRCGFHVDTVAPGLPTWGVLQVFNGAGTRWVDPGDVVSMARFYRWQHERDRLVRRVDDVRTRDARLARHDAAPDFLRPGSPTRVVPPRTTVVLRQLDARRHWSDHDPRLAWLHCSPMEGTPRLVVNVGPARPGPPGHGR
jgi:hypothetical protein